MRLVLAVVVVLTTNGSAWAKNRPLPRYGDFTYSNLCWGSDSGDASGTRFTLSRTRQGDRLTLEYGNGPLENARIKSLRMTGDRLQAEASTADGDLTLSAILNRKHAVVSNAFGDQKNLAMRPSVLVRIKRFSQKIPTC